MSDKISIIIADDHPIVRKGLRLVIEGDPQLTIVGEADDGVAALAMIAELRPSVVVLDLDMPELDGLGVAGELRKRGDDVRLVFLTLHAEEDLFNTAMDLGANSFILKDSAVLEIVRGIRAAATGEYFVSPMLSSYLVGRANRRTSVHPIDEKLALLTATERRIVRMLADYKSNKEIGTELFVHHRTVENHRAKICQKLELRGHHALLKFAVEHKSRL